MMVNNRYFSMASASVDLSDAIDSDSDATMGIAATPKAVNSLREQTIAWLNDKANSSEVPTLAGANSFTGANTFSGTATFTASQSIDSRGGIFLRNVNNRGVYIGGYWDGQYETVYFARGTDWNDWFLTWQFDASNTPYIGCRFKANVLPESNNTFSLGRATNGQWLNIFLQNSPTVASDKRLKDNINNLSSDEAKQLVSRLNPVSYVLKSDESGELRYGFIAQDVISIFDELGIDTDNVNVVIKDKDSEEGYLALRYEQFVPILWRETQRLQSVVDDQEKRISNLETQVKILMDELQKRKG